MRQPAIIVAAVNDAAANDVAAVNVAAANDNIATNGGGGDSSVPRPDCAACLLVTGGDRPTQMLAPTVRGK